MSDPVQYQKRSLSPNQSVFQTHNEVYGAPKKGSHHVTLIGILLLGTVALGGGIAFLQFREQKVATQSQQTQESQSVHTASSQKNEADCKRFTSLFEALSESDTACVLDLSERNLTSVPQEVYSLSNLVELDLSDNAISEFPVRLFEMKTLTNIDLSNNSITSIPLDSLTSIYEYREDETAFYHGDQVFILDGNSIVFEDVIPADNPNR